MPHGDKLGFAIVSKDGVELMYQTRASLRDDLPAIAEQSLTAFLYIEVDSLDDVVSKVGDAPVVVPRRTTSYGADELFVREPGGHIVGFAEHSRAE